MFLLVSCSSAFHYFSCFVHVQANQKNGTKTLSKEIGRSQPARSTCNFSMFTSADSEFVFFTITGLPGARVTTVEQYSTCNTFVVRNGARSSGFTGIQCV